MVRPSLLPAVRDTGLEVEHFHSPKWGACYAAEISLDSRGEPIDQLTVDAELGSTPGRPTLDELASAVIDVPSTGHAITYAQRVVDYAFLRRVIAACAEGTEAAYGDDAKRDVDGFADWFEATMLTACRRPVDEAGPVRWVDALDVAMAESKARSRGELRGVPTGLIDVDRLTGGLRPGLTVLGARPAHGKSAMALGIGLHTARRAGSTLIVSAEMGSGELAMRSLARGGVPSDRLLTGRLDQVDAVRLRAERDRQAPLPLFVDDGPASLAGVRSGARRLQAAEGLALVIVDYLQLVKAEGTHDRREREVANVSRGLKVLAGELGVPVLALSQLSRQVEYRADKRPVLADLRESGGLEADADLVLLLWRPGLYDLSADQGVAEVIVAKHRNGPTGCAPVAWVGSRMEFRDAAPPERKF
jgi:replicative DNA helicase